MFASVHLSEAQLISLCPTFIRTSTALRITGVGPTIDRLTPEARVGETLDVAFRTPPGMDVDELARTEGVVELTARNGVLGLRGLVLQEPHGYLFFVRPSVAGHVNLRELPQALRMTDFSLADASLSGMLNVCVHNELLGEIDDLVARLEVKRDEAIAAARAQVAFQASLTKLQTILDSSPDAFLIIDRQGEIVFANPQAESLFGYPGGELLGQAAALILPDPACRCAQGSAAWGERLCLSGERRLDRAEQTGLRRNGEAFTADVSACPLEIEEGGFLVATVRDTTERRRFEDLLRDKNRQLVEANRAQDHFLAAMSHELRAPLNTVIGFAGNLLMGLPGPLNEEQEVQLRNIRGAASNLLVVLNDLCDLARIDAGKLDLYPERFVLQDLMGEVTSTLRPLAEEKGLDFGLEGPGGGVLLETDRRALRQILLNLLGNAIKYTDHGRVRLSLRPAPDGEGRAIELSVTDTGVGISEDDQARLFEAFARGVSGRDHRREGPGLGLHISQRLAEMLGGRIRCASRLGRGSVFTLQLPLARS